MRVAYQQSRLENEALFPQELQLIKNFTNIVPFAMLQYNFSRQKNLRIFYRTNTNTPSVDQLQNVLDVSSAPRFRIGNPELDQNFQHNLTMRYSSANVAKSTNFFMMLSGNITQNAIVNHTILANQDSTLGFNNFLLRRGEQMTRPENLKGQYSIRSFMTYGVPLKFIKSNLNLNASADLNHLPGLINYEENFSDSRNVGLGITLSSNISEKLDFTLSSSSNKNYTENSLLKQRTTYFNQSSRARVNYIFWKDVVFQTEWNQIIFTGLAGGFNQNYNLWNVSLGKKLFKNKAGDVRVSVFDLLKQNNSVQRNITATYLEDVETLVLQRYFMLSFTYNIRKFGSNNNR
jgi:hypothetical protein